MNNINITFTYDLPDDQYYLTSDLKKVATNIYTGPEKVYVVVDAGTNKLTGRQITQHQHETYNETNTSTYSVEVDCNSDTLICSFFNGSVDPDRNQISEEIPYSIPYVRPEPPLPDHTYNMYEVEFNPATNSFKKPSVLRKPIVTWNDENTDDTVSKLVWRSAALAASDRQMSEDLPPALYTAMIEYREYLRNMPILFGVSWTVTLVSGGTGFAVGDRIAVTDTRCKNGQVADDIMITVTTVSNGAITGFTTASTRALQHSAAATYSNVYYTTNGAGIGAIFDVSKVKTVDAWKVTPKESPLK